MFYHGDADKTLNIDMVQASEGYVRDVVYKPYPDNYSFTIEHGMSHSHKSDKETALVKSFILAH